VAPTGVTVTCASDVTDPPVPVAISARASEAVGVMVSVPEVATLVPLSVAEVALVEVQVTIALCPATIDVGETVTVAVGTTVAGLTVTCACEVAVPPAPVTISL